MWPFSTSKSTSQPSNSPPVYSYSQLDITESFDDHLKLGPEDWIKTSPINIGNPNPEKVGLPPVNFSDNAVYEIGSRASVLRDQIANLRDGVYCPVCHIANTQLNRLSTPCPQCKRALLRFGWD